MIAEVNDPSALQAAAEIHAAAWQQSHASFCTEEFLKRHALTETLAELEMQQVMTVT